MGSVGKNLPHDSAVGHVTGGSVYVDDIPPMRNELVVDFWWSPVSHGTIRSIDLEEAAAIPGVVGLYTREDLHANLFGPIIHDEVLLAEDRVLFMGQPVVVIAAENRDSIRAAKRAIRVDIEELEPILTIAGAVVKHETIGDPMALQRGELARGFAEADHVIEGRFVNQGQDHFYLESQAAIAFPGEEGEITVHSSTQNPSEVQHVIAQVLGLRLNQVNCLTKRMGGAFGGKECQATHPAAMAALVARKTGRPARIVYTKDDDMQVTGKRHPFENDYKVGFRKDGRITALEVELRSDGGAYADLSTAVMGRAVTHVDNAYWLPNVRIRGQVYRTHTPPNTAFRGFGGPQGVATIENILEEIATVTGLDALDVRLANCYGIDDRNVTPYGQVVENNNLPRLFDELITRSGYRSRAAEVRRFNAASPTHLRGISMTAVKFGISFNTKFLNQANALVNVYLDGTVQVSTGATEMGQGVNTKIRQLVADELGIDPAHVAVMITSTEKNNNTSATAASSAADLNGSAAVDACRRIRERLLPLAAELLSPQNSDPASIIFEEGIVRDRRNAEARLTFAELVWQGYLRRISLGERGFYATPRIDFSWLTGQGHPFFYFTQGCAVSEVLIDRFTGELTVLRSDVLMDIGKPINPGIDRGQMTGGFIQGMGWVTTEDLRYDEKGWLLSHSPTTYKIPNIQDVPAVFNVDWLEIGNPVNIAGSKATGEPPLLLAISVWTAVKNALSHVSNGKIARLKLPATAEEIVMRLAELEEGARAEATTASRTHA
ncbi:MAG TPA: xanthine dehydrogenase molybdopterin binding subunit [Thermoanaerobaculia bacterium]|nr:xanthine dehydrogenase molybdopterin binding subunit [Thermoanaerobaculia bacterium]